MKKAFKFVFALMSGVMLASSIMVSYPLHNASHDTVARADYTSFQPLGDTKGGVNVSFTSDSTDYGATLKVIPQNKNIGTDGFYLRIKNNTGINTPISFYINGTNGHRVAIKTSTPLQTYSATGVHQGEITSREFLHFLMLPADFDGFIYFPGTAFESLPTGEWAGNNGTTMDMSSVYALYFGCSTLYDAYANFILGDIITETATIIDSSTISDMEFETTYAKDYMGEFVNTVRVANPKDIMTEGDFKGSATFSYTHTEDTTLYATARFHATTNDYSGDGLFLRMRNNTTTDTWVTFFMNGTNGHRVGPKANATYYTYDAKAENKTARTYREFGHYFALPASFDGYIYIPYATMESLPVGEWSGNEGTVMDYASVYACYFTMSTYFDSFANYTIGDVFTSSKSLFDGSEVTQADFGNMFVNDDANNPVIITQNEGYKSTEVSFDYGMVNYIGEFDKGAKLSFTAHADDVLSTIKIYPTISDYSAANAYTFRIKNLSGDYPFLFSVYDEAGAHQEFGGAAVGSVFFATGQGHVSSNIWGGNPLSTKVPYPFDGWCVIPMKSLSGTSVDLTKIAYFEIKVAVKYDYNFINIFGDVGYVKDDASMVTTLDVSTLNDTQFASAFAKGQNATNANIARYEADRPSAWIGDVKILDSLNYVSDEELKKNITWDPGDNKCTYAKDGEGMKVDIGPYESGHAYGDYMALAMFDKGATTDRKVWTVNQDGEQADALGVTMFLKNLSSREIGINLQFDESGVTAERWIVKGFPAMYYAYDTIKDADYVFYAKGDQIQIPVGFEGYVRIPFSSYLVPDWCHGEGFGGTDDVLDISKASGNFFLTSDCTKYEDLSFFIKNVGIYFHETGAGSLFNTNNTIKANMGLGA